MIVIYRGDATDAQVRWGDNDDPRGVLSPGRRYAVDYVEAHSTHTKYHIGGRRYNSVCFDEAGPTGYTCHECQRDIKDWPVAFIVIAPSEDSLFQTLATVSGGVVAHPGCLPGARR